MKVVDLIFVFGGVAVIVVEGVGRIGIASLAVGGVVDAMAVEIAVVTENVGGTIQVVARLSVRGCTAALLLVPPTWCSAIVVCMARPEG